GGLQDGRAVFARGDDRYFEPVTPQLTDEPNASLVSLHPHVLDGLGHQSVLAVPEPAHRFRLRRVVPASLPKVYAAPCAKVANAVVAGLAVYMEPVVRNDIEGPKCFASLRGTLLKIFIEHLFPARRVDLRSVRNYAVEIKKDRVVPVTVDHARALGLSHRSLSRYKGHPSTERQLLKPVVQPDVRESDHDIHGQVISVKRVGSPVKRCRPPSNEPRRMPLPGPISNP